MSRPVNNRKFVLSALVMIYTLHFNDVALFFQVKRHKQSRHEIDYKPNTREDILFKSSL